MPLHHAIVEATYPMRSQTLSKTFHGRAGTRAEAERRAEQRAKDWIKHIETSGAFAPWEFLSNKPARQTSADIERELCLALGV